MPLLIDVYPVIVYVLCLLYATCKKRHGVCLH